jgi:hypothetical protein
MLEKSSLPALLKGEGSPHRSEVAATGGFPACRALAAARVYADISRSFICSGLADCLLQPREPYGTS